MAERTWYLVRHGETDWNAERRMQGRFASRLNALGHQQARRSGETLARLGVECLYASPLLRVRETLAEINAYVPLTPVFDDRLEEWSAGDWSGFLYADIAKRWPAEFAAWDKDRYHVRAPGGENFVDLDQRAAAFLESINDVASLRLCIVAHGFINLALAARLLSLSPAETIASAQGNDVIIQIRSGDGVPEACHFVAGEGPIPGLPSASASRRRPSIA